MRRSISSQVAAPVSMLRSHLSGPVAKGTGWVWKRRVFVQLGRKIGIVHDRRGGRYVTYVFFFFFRPTPPSPRPHPQAVATI